MGTADAPDVAAWQGGAFTGRQALASGLTQGQVRYRLKTERWHRIAGAALSASPRPEYGWPAATLAHAAVLTWPDAVTGYQVAGALLGFPIPRAELTGPVQVFTRVNHPRREGLLAHRHARQPRQVVRLAGGLVVTGELRTAVDCLSAMSPDRAEDLYAWLTTRRRITHGDLTTAVLLLTGKHGVGALCDLQRRTANGAVSSAERRAHAVLRRAGITGWEAGAEVIDCDGRLIGVVDLLFRDAKVVVEIDGRRAHSDPVQFEKDRERQNRLVRAGYLVLRYTWRQLITNPDAVADEIRRTLKDRRFGATRAGS